MIIKGVLKNKTKNILLFLLIFLLVGGWFFSGWPQIYKNPPMPPKTPKVQAALPGIQHNFRWGLDNASSADIKNRPTVSGADDTKVSIKVGAATDSDQDPLLRLQITNTDAFPSSTVLEFVYTDCTNQSNLKTCATRILGGDDSTSWTYVGGRSATGGKFRMRQMAYDTGDTLDGTQISRVLPSAHNPTASAYMTKATTTTSFTSTTYPTTDISFEYYGSAPSVLETYLFAQVINGALVAFSAMHGTTGAILEIIPADWVGSAAYLSGVSITSATTATTILIFTDDSNTDSTTDFAYAIDTEHPTSWTTTCSSVSGGYDTHTFKDTTSGHKRTCDFSGLTANSIYWFKITHNDPDGYAGQSSQILGPYYTDQAKGAVALLVASKDSSEDSTGDTIDDLMYDDVESGTNPVKAMVINDGQYTIDNGGDVMHLDSFNTANFPASATLDKTWIAFRYGATGNKTYTHNINKGDAGTEPSACSAGGSPGTNWTSVWSVGSVSSNAWVGGISSSFTGYTVAQLGTMDVCLNNSSSGGSGHDLNFDHLQLINSYTPSSATISATTDAATQEAATTAQLNGTVDNRGASGVYYFQYGLTAGYGDTTAVTYFLNKIGTQEVYESISSLNSGTLYHFRVCVKAPPSATAVCGSDQTLTTTSGNAAPYIDNLSLVGGDINLNEGTFRWATSTMLITDTDTCEEVTIGGSVIATLYLASSTTAGTTCSQNDTSCYPDTTGGQTCIATTTGNDCADGADTTVEYDCGFKIWYIAEATDAGIWINDLWAIAATTTDTGALTGTATNTDETIEIITLNAISVTGTINYGGLDPGNNTGATNQLTQATTTGNTAIDVEVSETTILTKGSDTIDPWNQKYSLIDETYADLDFFLTSTTTPQLELTNIKPTSTTSPENDLIYWGLNVLAGTPNGSYSGVNLFTAVSD